MPDTVPTINTYLSDMLALEQHTQVPLKNQSQDSDVLKSATAERVVNAALQGVDTRIAALEARLEAVGGHAASPIKSSVSSALGAAASAIGNVRKTEVSKELRDDYTALCLTSAGYTMLHATALGLRDPETAAIAKKHLTDVAEIIMRLSSALPVVVLQELKEEGASVDSSVVETVEKNLEEAWHEGGERSAAGT